MAAHAEAAALPATAGALVAHGGGAPTGASSPSSHLRARAIVDNGAAVGADVVAMHAVAPAAPPVPPPPAPGGGGERAYLGNRNMLLSFIAGGAAGATAKTLIAPLDRVKIIFQVSNMRFTFANVAAEMRRTYATEGFVALFKGNAAQIARVYPYSGIQLMSFDVYSRALASLRHARASGSGGGAAAAAPAASAAASAATSDYHYRLTPGEKLLAGAAAGGTSVVITYPLDLMRARLAVQREGGAGSLRYEGLAAAFRRMHAAHGLANFYRGIGPTLGGIMPYAAISFTVFETAKHAVADRTGAEPTPGARMACGGLAGLAGQLCTYPLDIVRRRMQTEGFTPIHAHAGPAAAAAAEPVAAAASRGAESVAFAASSSAAAVPDGAASSQLPRAPSIAPSPAATAAAATAGRGAGLAAGAGPPPPLPTVTPLSAAAAKQFGYEFAAARLTTAQTLRLVVAHDGYRGLWKGFSMNLIKGPAGVGISFTFYDMLKRAWGIER